ncbi:hypothetical protein SAMN05444320_117102 [Streptoalloteichus hindustanus]|uniref:Uncharacterized protein n=1 Tax=Streptoalloteichus hindustanus TaxID=2017 RepID=A0A1M5P7V0_STRHI|nr:hypothetical protein SAMN05444320_117102 [Streptoalloteichus hindustanus]
MTQWKVSSFMAFHIVTFQLGGDRQHRLCSVFRVLPRVRRQRRPTDVCLYRFPGTAHAWEAIP